MTRIRRQAEACPTKLGNKDQARTWYNKAIAWMDKNRPKDEELLRFRAEAAALLGLAEAATSKKEGK